MASADRRPGAQAEAAEIRDRMRTLLVRAYTEAQRIGGYKWVLELGDHVPTLGQRRR